MITLKEISEKCHVSIATVSNILNGKSNVSEQTKERVLAVVKETGYKPNYMARGLRASTSKTIGMIVDDITAFGSPKIIEGIMEVCEYMNYRAIMSNLRIYSKWLNKEHTHEDFLDLVNSAIDELLSIKVDGIIYVGAYTREINFLPVESPVPFSIAYSTSENNQIPSVCIDDVTSSYEITKHLITHNHKKIAVIAGEQGGLHSDLRLEGFKKALSDNNIIFDEKLKGTAKWDMKTAIEACKNMNLAQLIKNKEVTAVYCFNDLMATGVYAYLGENNLKPGKDVSVAGFDNRECSEAVSPQLTTIAIQLYGIGRKTAEILFSQIRGEQMEEKLIKIPGILFERESVQKI